MSVGLQALDWAIVACYLVVALGVGLAVRREAGADRRSYFLAGQGLSGWWAGLSIAATTFAADTPLAVTGLVATRGLSGNWLWLSRLFVHAAVVAFFASTWRRTGVVTDAELISLRYSGRAADWLRGLRAGVYGTILNSLTLAWVLRAMIKVAEPVFAWERWTPELIAWLAGWWPAGAGIPPSQALTVLALLAVVAIYSSLGGLRGVVLTDLVQLSIAIIGSVALAYYALEAVGGIGGLIQRLRDLYGVDHRYIELFPRPEGWLAETGVGIPLFVAYLLVQGLALSPADGGGYVMQRLNATRSVRDARTAALSFLVIQYLLRVWPWFLVALAALALIPITGNAAEVDREATYPLLALRLLPAGLVGLLVTSLLAAFMSTVDTHLNWGGSYVVTDIYLRLRPRAGADQQLRVARAAVVFFVVVALLVSFHIDSIARAWQWRASFGAAIAVPTLVRWFWWRVTALSELTALGAGLLAALLMAALDLGGYELRLLGTTCTSGAGMLIGILVGPQTDPAQLRRFVERARPYGWWRVPQAPGGSLATATGQWLLLCGGLVIALAVSHRWIFASLSVPVSLLAIAAIIALALGSRAKGQVAGE